MKDESLIHPTSPLPTPFVRTLYERMLLTRLVDTYVFDLYKEEHTPTFASCRGYEAAQVGSAACIEIGQDFTLPYSRDLGVFLTLGMTPYEVFRTHLTLQDVQQTSQQYTHWKYHKHNTVTGSAPVATQILHAAGIAFASKLRKVPVVTIAYCGDDVVSEPDFLEEGALFGTASPPNYLYLRTYLSKNVGNLVSCCRYAARSGDASIATRC